MRRLKRVFGVLVCSITEYFYSLFVFCLALEGSSKYSTTRTIFEN